MAKAPLQKKKRPARKVVRRPAATPRRTRARKPFVIDMHAHIQNPPEVMAFTKGRTIDSSIPPGTPEDLAAQDRRWVEDFTRKQNDLTLRLEEMDRAGVDVQVLTTGILRSCTYWATPEDGLRKIGRAHV